MRVLHIMNELAPSGAETMLCIGAKVFQSAGVDATVLSTGSSIGSFSKEFKEAGYKVEHVVFGKSLAFFKELYIFYFAFC
mgnify:FL=1